MSRVIGAWLAIVLFAAAPPAFAQDSHQPKNALGLGLGETTGLGLVYQRVLIDGWRGRAMLGGFPGGGSHPFTSTFAGGGVLRDLTTFRGGRTYVLTTGLYKQVAVNETHASVVPGVGMQWGPWALEAGISFFRTDRDGGSGYIYRTWGFALALGTALRWEF